MIEMLPSHRTSASNACASVSWQRWARCSRSGVAGGVPPLGAFNPPATEGVPTACQTHFQLALSNHSWPISTFFRAIRSEVFFPLSFPFPRSLGTTADPAPRSGKMGLCGFFFSIFCEKKSRSMIFRSPETQTKNNQLQCMLIQKAFST